MTLSATQYQLDIATTNLQLLKLQQTLAEAEVALAHISLGREDEVWAQPFGNAEPADIYKHIEKVHKELDRIYFEFSKRRRSNGSRYRVHHLVQLQYSSKGYDYSTDMYLGGDK